jgi:predicted DNA binding protein
LSSDLDAISAYFIKIKLVKLKKRNCIYKEEVFIEGKNSVQFFITPKFNSSMLKLQTRHDLNGLERILLTRDIARDQNSDSKTN